MHIIEIEITHMESWMQIILSIMENSKTPFDELDLPCTMYCHT